MWFGLGNREEKLVASQMDKKSAGNLGEDIAVSFLSKRDYHILERNFRCRGGEVDIIACDPRDGALVFVEVKTRRNLSYGVPQVAVNQFKQRKISKAALTWLSAKHLDDETGRFDVIAIMLLDDGDYAIEHIINAFEVAC